MSEEMNVQETTGMVVNESMKADLRTSAKWAKFLCIVGCIGIALMLIVAVLMFTMGGSMFKNFPVLAGMGGVIGIYYLIFVAIMVYPLIKGFQFANGVKAACLTGNEAELARGFAGMKGYLQYISVLTIIVLIIYGLSLIGLVAAVALI